MAAHQAAARLSWYQRSSGVASYQQNMKRGGKRVGASWRKKQSVSS